MLMISNCLNLESLDVSKFNVENVRDFSGMFRYCLKLKIIDVKSFKTKSAKNMAEMFLSCKEITHLELNNFITIINSFFHSKFSCFIYINFINYFLIFYSNTNC